MSQTEEDDTGVLTHTEDTGFLAQKEKNTGAPMLKEKSTPSVDLLTATEALEDDMRAENAFDQSVAEKEDRIGKSFSLLEAQIASLNEACLFRDRNLSEKHYSIDGKTRIDVMRNFENASDPMAIFVMAGQHLSEVRTSLLHNHREKMTPEEEGKVVNMLKYLVDNHKEAITKGALSAASNCHKQRYKPVKEIQYPHGKNDFTSCF